MRRDAKRRSAARAAATLAAAVVLSGCGGRASDPLPLRTDLDPQLDCVQLTAQRSFLVQRIADLEDERADNRARTLSRVPGALIGSPVTAILLADPSIAVYREIDAAEKRDAELARLQSERGCDVAAPGAPEEEAEPLAPFTVEDYRALGAATTQ